MRVENIYRYPVKGLNPESLDEVELSPGQTLPWDRAFALAQGDADFDPAAPHFLPKSNFMCLLKNERIAHLRATWDPHDRCLTIRAPEGESVAASPLDAPGRETIATFLTSYLGEEARGEPIFHFVPGHHFADDSHPLVSLLSLSSLRRFEQDLAETRDAIRFRANIQFCGGEPWAEFSWIDRTLEIGSATLRVVQRIRRCNATQVNPQTAVRDADPVRELRTRYGHTDFGILAEVVEGGRVAVGDAIRVAGDAG